MSGELREKIFWCRYWILVAGKVNKNGVFVATSYEPRMKVSDFLKKSKWWKNY